MAKAEHDEEGAELFKRVADDMEAELDSRLLQAITRSVLDESRAVLREARNLVSAAVNG